MAFLGIGVSKLFDVVDVAVHLVGDTGLLLHGLQHVLTQAVDARSFPGAALPGIQFRQFTRSGQKQSGDHDGFRVRALHVARGLEGGPFTSDNQTYALANPSAQEFAGTSQWTAAWLDVAPNHGDLAAQTTQTVTVALADELLTTPGVYSDVVAFSNLVTHGVFTRAVTVTVVEITGDAEAMITDALRDLANWLYRELEQEYEYLISDEAVDETMVANGYTFTEEGRRFG